MLQSAVLFYSFDYFTIQTGFTQLCIQSSLDDSKQVLFIRFFVRCYAPVQPANGSVHGLLNSWARHCTADHIVQLHHDVRACWETEKHHCEFFNESFQKKKKTMLMVLISMILDSTHPSCSVCWWTFLDLEGSLCRHRGTWTWPLPLWPLRVQQERPSETPHCPKIKSKQMQVSQFMKMHHLPLLLRHIKLLNVPSYLGISYKYWE